MFRRNVHIYEAVQTATYQTGRLTFLYQRQQNTVEPPLHDQSFRWSHPKVEKYGDIPIVN